jgi:predicted peptidase
MWNLEKLEYAVINLRCSACLLLISVSLTTVFGQDNTMTERQVFVKKESIRSVDLMAGRQVHDFQLSNKTNWPVHLSIPEIKDGEKVPLIIALHWAGGGNTFMDYSNCLVFPALEFLNAIIVVPSSNFGNWAYVKNEKKIIDLIKRLIRHWPVDKEKIIITGYSNGAIGSWEYARKHPKLFAAVMPVSGYYEAHKVKVPVYALHGVDDDLFRLEKVKAAFENSIKKGSDIKFKYLKNYGHYNACSYVDELKEMAKIIETDIIQANK